MAAVNSRIPHGRSSRIPGVGNSSRLPHSSNRQKTSNLMSVKQQFSSGKQTKTKAKEKSNCISSESYQLTYIKQSNDTSFGNNLNKKNYSSIVMPDVDELTFTEDSINSKDLEENCEIVSLCSANPSPFKELTELESEDNDEPGYMKESGNDNEQPTKTSNVFAYMNIPLEQKHSEKEATQNSSIGGNNRKNETRFQTKNLIPKNKVNTPKTTSMKSVSKPSSSLVSRSLSSVKARESPRLQIVQKGQAIASSTNSNLSAATAMDFVKKVTAKEPNRTINTVNPTFNGSSSKVSLSTVSNTHHQINASRSKIGSTLHTEKRNLYQPSKLRSSNSKGMTNVAEAVHVFEYKEMQPDRCVLMHRLTDGDSRKLGSGMPRIVRPVTRPPRNRSVKENNQKQPTPDISTTPSETFSTASYIDEIENQHVCNGAGEILGEKEGAGDVLNRINKQVVGASLHENCQQLFRRISNDDKSLDQANCQLTVNMVDSSWPSPGAAPPLDRSPTHNDRYKDVLENPNKALSRVLSVESDMISVSLEDSSHHEQVLHSTHDDVIRNNSTSSLHEDYREAGDGTSSVLNGRLHRSPVHSTTMLNNLSDDDPDYVGASKWAPEDKAHQELDDKMDLPSLNSTVLMDDYSSSSPWPTPSHRKTCPSSTPEHSSVHSSPTRTRDASNDISKFCETASTASSSGYLQTTLDELVGEYKMVRGALEDLHQHLSEEQMEKNRLEQLVTKLRTKNSNLVDEVNHLTRIMEFQMSPANKRRNSPTDRKPTMCDAESQTEQSKAWYKTEFSFVDTKTLVAIERLNKAAEFTENLHQTVASAQEELQNVVEQFQQI